MNGKCFAAPISLSVLPALLWPLWEPLFAVTLQCLFKPSLASGFWYFCLRLSNIVTCVSRAVAVKTEQCSFRRAIGTTVRTCSLWVFFSLFGIMCYSLDGRTFSLLLPISAGLTRRDIIVLVKVYLRSLAKEWSEEKVVVLSKGKGLNCPSSPFSEPAPQ